MENYLAITVFVCAVLALVFAGINFFAVKRKPEGTEEMANISAKIRKGAMA